MMNTMRRKLSSNLSKRITSKNKNEKWTTRDEKSDKNVLTESMTTNYDLEGDGERYGYFWTTSNDTLIQTTITEEGHDEVEVSFGGTTEKDETTINTDTTASASSPDRSLSTIDSTNSDRMISPIDETQDENDGMNPPSLLNNKATMEGRRSASSKALKTTKLPSFKKKNQKSKSMTNVVTTSTIVIMIAIISVFLSPLSTVSASDSGNFLSKIGEKSGFMNPILMPDDMRDHDNGGSGMYYTMMDQTNIPDLSNHGFPSTWYSDHEGFLVALPPRRRGGRAHYLKHMIGRKLSVEKCAKSCSHRRYFGGGYHTSSRKCYCFPKKRSNKRLRYCRDTKLSKDTTDGFIVFSRSKPQKCSKPFCHYYSSPTKYCHQRRLQKQQ